VGESYARNDDRPAVNTTVGIGWGRFINATALRRAVRIDTFLVNEGVTSERMPKQTMLDLAHIIDREEEYRDTHGDFAYKKAWYDDMEETIRSSGKLDGESLGAVGVLRIDEVLFQENIGDRFIGWDATVGVRYDITLADENAARPAPGADFTLRYARPITWVTQFDAQANVSSPMDEQFGKAYRLASSAGFLYEFTNRVDFRIDYLVTVSKANDLSDVKTSHSVLPTFLFYIENELQFLAGLRLIKPTGEKWTQEFTIGLNYKAL
ncbi:MAG: hypothetical protein O3A46_13645, partial [Candidatus Poribacteria bacterium]|nr:hypothetical protein [Candidatus Poribacteria bacterium]